MSTNSFLEDVDRVVRFIQSIKAVNFVFYRTIDGKKYKISIERVCVNIEDK